MLPDFDEPLVAPVFIHLRIVAKFGM